MMVENKFRFRIAGIRNLAVSLFFSGERDGAHSQVARDVRFVLPALFLVVVGLALWVSTHYSSFAGVVSAGLVFVLLINALVRLTNTMASKHMQLVPKFRGVAGWLMLMLCGLAVYLSSVFILMGSYSILAIVGLWLTLKVKNEAQRHALVLVFLVGIELVVLVICTQLGTFEQTASAVVVLMVQLRLVAVVAVAFLTLALLQMSPFLGAVAGLLSALAWLLTGASLHYFKAPLYSGFGTIFNIGSIFGDGLVGDLVFYALAVILLRVLFAIAVQGAALRRSGKFKWLSGLAQEPTLSLAKMPTGGVRMGKTWSWLPSYNFWLLRASSAPFDFNRLVAYCFPREMHWAMGYAVAFAIGGVVLILGFLLPVTGQITAKAVIAFLPDIFLACTLVLCGRQLASRLRYKREHSLLSLTPNWPKPRVVNRAYAQHLLLFFFAMAASAAVVKVVVGSVFGLATTLPVTIVASLLGIFLPIIFVLPVSVGVPLTNVFALPTALLAICIFSLIGGLLRQGSLMLATYFCAACVVGAAYRYWRYVGGKAALPVSPI